MLQKAELHAAALYLSYLVGMRQSIARIKADVVAKGGSLVAAYLFMRCDETPLMMTVVDNDLLTLLPDELQAQLQLAQEKLLHVGDADEQADVGGVHDAADLEDPELLAAEVFSMCVCALLRLVCTRKHTCGPLGE